MECSGSVALSSVTNLARLLLPLAFKLRKTATFISSHPAGRYLSNALKTATRFC